MREMRQIGGLLFNDRNTSPIAAEMVVDKAENVGCKALSGRLNPACGCGRYPLILLGIHG